MHPLPRRTLRRLIAQYGPALLDQPARVDALLADLCGPYQRERFLLVHALRDRIPAELLAQPQGGTIHWLRLSQRLQRRYGFSAEAAQWAIESWALALNIVPLTSRLPRPLAALIRFLQRKIPLPQIQRPSFASPTGANRQNRVQYWNRVGRFLPGWAWLTVAALIVTVASGAAWPNRCASCGAADRRRGRRTGTRGRCPQPNRSTPCCWPPSLYHRRPGLRRNW